MADVGKTSIDPQALANQLSAVMDNQAGTMLVSVASLEFMAKHPQVFPIEKGQEDGLLFAGVPLCVSEHLGGKNGIHALGLS